MPAVFCFSYASKGNARVEEAKAALEAMGHRVFWGLNVRAAAAPDWRKQWCMECSQADFCINFLSAFYVRSDPCAEEWSYSKSTMDATSIVNVLVGGRDAREQLLAVPVEEVADQGGMAIQNHFRTGGQAVSVYAEDDIAEKILAEVEVPTPHHEDVGARRQEILENPLRTKEEAPQLAPPQGPSFCDHVEQLQLDADEQEAKSEAAEAEAAVANEVAERAVQRHSELVEQAEAAAERLHGAPDAIVPLPVEAQQRQTAAEAMAQRCQTALEVASDRLASHWGTAQPTRGAVRFAEDDRCWMCMTEFSFFARRHHCRDCGQSVCSAHSEQERVLSHRPAAGSQGVPQRVCDRCHAEPLQMVKQAQAQVHADCTRATEAAAAAAKSTAHALAESEELNRLLQSGKLAEAVSLAAAAIKPAEEVVAAARVAAKGPSHAASSARAVADKAQQELAENTQILAAFMDRELLPSAESVTAVDTLRREGITSVAGMAGLTDEDLAYAGINLAASRKNFQARVAAEAAEAKVQADAEALRALVNGWGLPAALAAAITQCQPPLTVGKLLELATDRRAFEAALGGGCTLSLMEWKAVEAKAAEVRCAIFLSASLCLCFCLCLCLCLSLSLHLSVSLCLSARVRVAVRLCASV